MKKLLVTVFALGTLSFAAQAQTSTAAAKPELTKEEKVKLKQKQEEQLTASFKEAGLSDDEIAKVSTIMQEGRKKRNDLKKNTALTEADREAQTKATKEEEKAKLIDVLGKEKYKIWRDALKKQKEADTAQ
jgi:hypothetical protein